jgi:uncharacterized protein YbjT (DUF2867 family)
MDMFAITGITGQVGGVLARTLLADGVDVRAVVRNAHKGKAWAAQGCEVALADMNDADALQKAFTNVEGVFVLLPPTFDPSHDFSEAQETITAIRAALLQAKPEKVVCLSTIGAQAAEVNLLTQLQMLEQSLATLPMPVTFLRAAWFIENAAWDVETVRQQRLMHSFLQPLDKPVPMVATADVGKVAAELLRESWQGLRVIELEGPQRISPLDLATGFARVLGHTVSVEPVPRNNWHSLFSAQGMQNPQPRMRMLDGFNEGWIKFEGAARKGSVCLETALQGLLEKS